jgi:hypothetical protein
MAFDAVGTSLDRCQAEHDPQKRIRLLTRLVHTGDPRVAVALGEAMYSDKLSLCYFAAIGFAEYAGIDLGEGYANEWLKSKPDVRRIEEGLVRARDWWHANQAYLRQRAKEVPPNTGLIGKRSRGGVLPTKPRDGESVEPLLGGSWSSTWMKQPSAPQRTPPP